MRQRCVFTSHNFAQPSRDVDTMLLPVSAKSIDVTPALCPCMVATQTPERGDQILRVVSMLPVTATCSEGKKRQVSTTERCPAKHCYRNEHKTFHERRVEFHFPHESFLALTRSSPFCFPHRRTVPVWSADIPSPPNICTSRAHTFKKKVNDHYDVTVL